MELAKVINNVDRTYLKKGRKQKHGLNVKETEK